MNLGLWGGLAGLGKGLIDVGTDMEEDRKTEQKKLSEVELMKMRDQIERNRHSDQLDDAENRRQQKVEKFKELDQAGYTQAQDEAQGPVSDSQQADIKRNALFESGLIDAKDVMADERSERKDAREEKKLDQMAARDALRTALQERKLDLDAKKIDAMISRMGGGGSGAVSAFVQNFDKIKRETGWDSSKVLDYMNSAKQRGEEWSVTEGQGAYGNPTKSVTRKGTGTPPGADSGPNIDSLFPPKKK